MALPSGGGSLIYDPELGYILAPQVGDTSGNVTVVAPPGWQPATTPDSGTTTYYDPGVSPGSGSGEPADDPGTINWRAWLDDWGFPPEVVDELDKMSRRYTPAQADMFARDAILYLRGTDWYAKTFPGITEGFKTGLIQNERGYRAYVSQVNDAYKRYLGRDITTDELVLALRNQWDPSRVEGELNAGAWVKTNRGDMQFLLGAFDTEGQTTEKGLLSLGEQQAGIGNSVGTDLARRVAMAQARLNRIFEGTLATPGLSLDNGLSAPSLGAGKSNLDVGK